MFVLWQWFLVLGYFVGRIKAQTGVTLANGDYYVCVPAGSCNNGGTPPSTGIDPRIVTPGQLCPSGQVACYTQGPSSRCGQRLVTPAPSTTDVLAPYGANPWQAYMVNASGYSGSGVLIDNYHVLTVAHKVAGDVNSPGNVRITMGMLNPTPPNSPNNQTRTAVKIVTHPNYNPSTLTDDIAVVRVSPAFSLSQPDINTLCLPVASATNPYIGQTCRVAGWGETSFKLNDQPTNPMKQVEMPAVDPATCRTRLLPVLSTVDTYLQQNGAEVCAGGNSMEDACTYDGGSPLTCPSNGQGNIAGLVIWGKGCGQANVPGVYVSVPAYRQWIITQVSTP